MLAKHNKSQSQIAQRETADNFIAMHSCPKDIKKCISSQYNEIVEKDHQIL